MFSFQSWSRPGKEPRKAGRPYAFEVRSAPYPGYRPPKIHSLPHPRQHVVNIFHRPILEQYTFPSQLSTVYGQKLNRVCILRSIFSYIETIRHALSRVCTEQKHPGYRQQKTCNIPGNLGYLLPIPLAESIQNSRVPRKFSERTISRV